jgi:hypothetical protein
LIAILTPLPSLGPLAAVHSAAAAAATYPHPPWEKMQAVVLEEEVAIVVKEGEGEEVVVLPGAKTKDVVVLDVQHYSQCMLR